MKTLSYHHFIFLLAGLLFASAVNAQTAYMHGSTYEERGHSLIDQMLQTQPVDNGNIKYVSPFYFARLWRDCEKEKAIEKLTEMYQYHWTMWKRSITPAQIWISLPMPHARLHAHQRKNAGLAARKD